MSPTEVTTVLRQFNDWRRGADDLQPKPREIGLAIDAALEMIERMRNVEVALREIEWSNDSKWQADRAHSVLEKSK